MQNPLIEQLTAREHITNGEQQILQSLVTSVKEVGAGKVIVSAGARTSESCLVLEGLACQYKALSKRRRQITAFYLPGDFVDLHSFILRRVDQAILALTACTIGIVSHQSLLDVTEHHPRLTRLLWLCTLIDAATYREWVAAMGHLSAQARTAHLFCELFVRLKLAGRINQNSFSLPITQTKLAEALGVSNVHINRILRQLRATDVVRWENDTVTIVDWKQLHQIAHFDPAYLHLQSDTP
jgi:CRP-like cAMP-binding protein